MMMMAKRPSAARPRRRSTAPVRGVCGSRMGIGGRGRGGGRLGHIIIIVVNSTMFMMKLE